jgi:hypothetical protein
VGYGMEKYLKNGTRRIATKSPKIMDVANKEKESVKKHNLYQLQLLQLLDKANKKVLQKALLGDEK